MAEGRVKLAALYALQDKLRFALELSRSDVSTEPILKGCLQRVANIIRYAERTEVYDATD